MSPRARRQKADGIEMIAQGILGVLLLLGLAIGGIGGFAQVMVSLLMLGLIGLAAFGICFLVLRSRLIRSKRIGLCLLIVGGLTAWLWRGLQPPPTWTESVATIRSVVSPPCTTEIDYSFQDRGVTRTFSQRKDWPTVDAAHRGSAAPITVYFNSTRPTELSDKPINGWVRVSATPHTTRYEAHGDYRSTIAFGSSPLLMFTATITGPSMSKSVGEKIPIWINPLNPKEANLTVRETIGGKKYPMLGLAIMLLTTGVVLLVAKRGWIDFLPETVSATGFDRPVASPNPPPALTVREQLDRIDWYQFEKICARILERTGSSVERSGGANPDGGADIIARRDGRTAVVQCKHWKRTFIAPKILRELLGTKASAGFAASDAILFSLSDCTEEAKRFAEENGIQIFEADRIAKMIDDLGSEHFSELSTPDRKFCPRCDAPMILREVATPFWGCSRYPTNGCRGKIESG